MFKNDDGNYRLPKEKPNLGSSNSGESRIKPLRDFVIHQNDVHIELKDGEETMVPKRFLENLKNEKVIGGWCGIISE